MDNEVLTLTNIDQIISHKSELADIKVLSLKGELLGPTTVNTLISIFETITPKITDIIIEETTMGNSALDIVKSLNNPSLKVIKVVSCGICSLGLIEKFNWLYEYKGETVTIDFSRNLISDSAINFLNIISKLKFIKSINISENFISSPEQFINNSKIVIGNQRTLVKLLRSINEERIWQSYYEEPIDIQLLRASRTIDYRDIAECVSMEEITRCDIISESNSTHINNPNIYKIIISLGTGVYSGEYRIRCGLLGPIFLDLSNLQLEDDVFMCVMKIARFVKTLLCLDLRSNNLSCEKVSNGLMLFEGLKCVKLGDNKEVKLNDKLLAATLSSGVEVLSIDDVGVCREIQGLRSLRIYNLCSSLENIHSKTLKHINLDHSNLSISLYDLLTIMSENLPSLESLSVRNCGIKIDNKGVSTALNMRAGESQLTELYLDGDIKALTDEEFCLHVMQRDDDHSINLISICGTELFEDDGRKELLSETLKRSSDSKFRALIVHVGRGNWKDIIGLEEYAGELDEDTVELIKKRCEQDETIQALKLLGGEE